MELAWHSKPIEKQPDTMQLTEVAVVVGFNVQFICRDSVIAGDYEVLGELEVSS